MSLLTSSPETATIITNGNMLTILFCSLLVTSKNVKITLLLVYMVPSHLFIYLFWGCLGPNPLSTPKLSTKPRILFFKLLYDISLSGCIIILLKVRAVDV